VKTKTAAILGAVILLSTPFAMGAAKSGRPANLLSGRLYCLSSAAVQDYIRAQKDPDDDRSRDRLYNILWVRKVCDFTQAPVSVEVIQEGAVSARVMVLTIDRSWRRKSKVPWNGGTLYVKSGDV
jgi:hypothetical protein